MLPLRVDILSENLVYAIDEGEGDTRGEISSNIEMRIHILRPIAIGVVVKLDENFMKIQVPKIQDLLERDPYLKLHEWDIRRRYGMFQELVQRTEANKGSLEQFTRDWDDQSHIYKQLPFGKWELVIPPTSDGQCAIPHLSKLKISLKTQKG
ncbi:unnamed protein product, partial [Cyprideis torosa]